MSLPIALIRWKNYSETYNMHPRLANLLASHAPGIHTDVPAALYHAGPGVSRSHLAKLAESPFELHYSLTTPEADAPTEAQKLGTMLDFFIERGSTESLPVGYVAIPDVHLGSKEGRKHKEAWPDSTLVKTPAVDTTVSCYDAIMKHRRIARMIAESQRQLSVYSDFQVIWDCPMFHVDEQAVCEKVPVNLTRRCRPDLVPPPDWLADGYTFMVDIKTTRCDLSDKRNWWRECWEFGYFMQAGWYLNTCRAAGLDRTLFTHLVVETHPPFRVRMFYLPPEEVEAAYQRCLELLAQLVACVKADSWPDTSDIILPLKTNLP